MTAKDVPSRGTPALDAALAYANAGIPVHPVAGKRPLTKWKDAASTDPAIIRGWWKRWPDAGVAVVTGARSGLFVVDLDIDKETGEAIGEAAAAELGLSECFTGAPVARTGSGGRHVFFRAEPGLDNSASKLAAGVDTRGEGGFVVAAGSPGYVWLGPSILELPPPPVPEKLRAALRAGKGETPAPAPDPGNVVPFSPMQALARELAASRSIGGPNAWAETALERELATLRAQAKGGRNHALNAAAFSLGQIVAGGGLKESRVRDELAAAARAIGLEEHEIGPTISSGLSDGMTKPRTAPEKPIVLDSGFPAFPAGFDPVAARKAELAARLVRAGDVRPLLTSPYLVKGWLDRGAMSVVYGESNVGKSFFALDVARAVARGEPWAGCRVMGGPVFYLAAEGGRSFVNRVAALEGVAERLFVLPVSVDLCSSELDARALSELLEETAAAHGDPALLVADTLARSMGTGDENAAPDMGAFVRNVDAIRDATSAHVMVIHHSGKDRAKGARGHSSLRAATDTEIELTAEGGVVLAEAKKQRDMANGRRFAYRLEEIELGRDQDGDPVTTCRVVPCDVPDAGADRRKPSPSEARVLEALRQYVDDHGKPNTGGTGWPEIGSRLVVRADAFKAFAREKQHHETAKERSRAVRDALAGLEGKGLVAFNEGHVWIVKREGTEGT